MNSTPGYPRAAKRHVGLAVYIVIGVILVICAIGCLLQYAVPAIAASVIIKTRYPAKTALVISYTQAFIAKSAKARDLLGDKIVITSIPGDPLEFGSSLGIARGGLEARGTTGSGILTLECRFDPSGASVTDYKQLELYVDSAFHDLLKQKPQ